MGEGDIQVGRHRTVCKKRRVLEPLFLQISVKGQQTISPGMTDFQDRQSDRRHRKEHSFRWTSKSAAASFFNKAIQLIDLNKSPFAKELNSRE
jgi:hypothetical protein